MIRLNLMCPCELCPSVFKLKLELLGFEIIKTKFLQKILLWELWDNSRDDNHHQKIASVALMFIFVFTRFASPLSICIGFAFIRSSRPLWLYYWSSFGNQEVWSDPYWLLLFYLTSMHISLNMVIHIYNFIRPLSEFFWPKCVSKTLFHICGANIPV